VKQFLFCENFCAHDDRPPARPTPFVPVVSSDPLPSSVSEFEFIGINDGRFVAVVAVVGFGGIGGFSFFCAIVPVGAVVSIVPVVPVVAVVAVVAVVSIGSSGELVRSLSKFEFIVINVGRVEPFFCFVDGVNLICLFVCFFSSSSGPAIDFLRLLIRLAIEAEESTLGVFLEFFLGFVWVFLLVFELFLHSLSELELEPLKLILFDILFDNVFCNDFVPLFFSCGSFGFIGLSLPKPCISWLAVTLLAFAAFDADDVFTEFGCGFGGGYGGGGGTVDVCIGDAAVVAVDVCIGGGFGGGGGTVDGIFDVLEVEFVVCFCSFSTDFSCLT
jgi:hypothetical protein